MKYSLNRSSEILKSLLHLFEAKKALVYRYNDDHLSKNQVLSVEDLPIVES